MPLIKLGVKAEETLASSSLYTESNRDDPCEILEGVCMSTLVGIVRQLGHLAEYSANIFEGLENELKTISNRTEDIKSRAKDLEFYLPKVEEKVLKGNESSSSSRYSSSELSGVNETKNAFRNTFNSRNRPLFVTNLLNDCHDYAKHDMDDEKWNFSFENDQSRHQTSSNSASNSSLSAHVSRTFPHSNSDSGLNLISKSKPRPKSMARSNSESRSRSESGSLLNFDFSSNSNVSRTLDFDSEVDKKSERTVGAESYEILSKGNKIELERDRLKKNELETVKLSHSDPNSKYPLMKVSKSKRENYSNDVLQTTQGLIRPGVKAELHKGIVETVSQEKITVVTKVKETNDIKISPDKSQTGVKNKGKKSLSSELIKSASGKNSSDFDEQESNSSSFDSSFEPNIFLPSNILSKFKFTYRSNEGRNPDSIHDREGENNDASDYESQFPVDKNDGGYFHEDFLRISGNSYSSTSNVVDSTADDDNHNIAGVDERSGMDLDAKIFEKNDAKDDVQPTNKNFIVQAIYDGFDDDPGDTRGHIKRKENEECSNNFEISENHVIKPSNDEMLDLSNVNNFVVTQYDEIRHSAGKKIVETSDKLTHSVGDIDRLMVDEKDRDEKRQTHSSPDVRKNKIMTSLTSTDGKVEALPDNYDTKLPDGDFVDHPPALSTPPATPTLIPSASSPSSLLSPISPFLSSLLSPSFPSRLSPHPSPFLDFQSIASTSPHAQPKSPHLNQNQGQHQRGDSQEHSIEITHTSCCPPYDEKSKVKKVKHRRRKSLENYKNGRKQSLKLRPGKTVWIEGENFRKSSDNELAFAENNESTSPNFQFSKCLGSPSRMNLFSDTQNESIKLNKSRIKYSDSNESSDILPDEISPSRFSFLLRRPSKAKKSNFIKFSNDSVTSNDKTDMKASKSRKEKRKKERNPVLNVTPETSEIKNSTCDGEGEVDHMKWYRKEKKTFDNVDQASLNESDDEFNADDNLDEKHFPDLNLSSKVKDITDDVDCIVNKDFNDDNYADSMNGTRESSNEKSLYNVGLDDYNCKENPSCFIEEIQEKTRENVSVEVLNVGANQNTSDLNFNDGNEASEPMFGWPLRKMNSTHE